MPLSSAKRSMSDRASVILVSDRFMSIFCKLLAGCGWRLKGPAGYRISD